MFIELWIVRVNEISVRFRSAPAAPWVEVRMPEGTDVWALVEAARLRIFPGVAVVPYVAPAVEKPERKRRGRK